jgi:hypothetical protein
MYNSLKILVLFFSPVHAVEGSGKKKNARSFGLHILKIFMPSFFI